MSERNYESMLSDTEFEIKVAVNPKYALELPELINEGRDSVLVAYTLALTYNNRRMHEAIFRTYGRNMTVFGFNNPHISDLRNTYFDTDDDELFRRFSAGLRIRRSSTEEGAVQTLKMRGSAEGAAHSHLELNESVSEKCDEPNLRLFNQAQLTEEFRRSLEDLQKNLKPKYHTDFKRFTADITLPVAGTFELAVDTGRIGAGGSQSEISELELELKRIAPCSEMLFNDMYERSHGSPNDADDLKLGLVFLTMGFMKSLNRHLINNRNMDAVFGLEPFSKLRRAVLLKMAEDEKRIYAKILETNDEDERNALQHDFDALDSQLHMDFTYEKYMERLMHSGEEGPALLDYIACGEQLMKSFFDATGKVRLFGSVRSLEELHQVLVDCINFTQASWYFKDAETDPESDEKWGLCALFRRQSFWGALGRCFTDLVDDVHYKVDSLLQEQKLEEKEEDKEAICRNAAEFFYNSSPALIFDLPLLMHLTSYCFKRYRQLLSLQDQPEAFAALASSTSIVLSDIIPQDAAERLLSGRTDVDDMKVLFREFF